MDFWRVYGTEKTRPRFGATRLHITSRDRIHLSLSSVESCCLNLEMSQAMARKYAQAGRFVLAKELTHDLFISIYNVNTNDAILLRASTPMSDAVTRNIISEAKKMKNPNLEMRIAGLQDGDTGMLSAAESLHKAFRSNLMEVDIFGNETRHLVFDLKLGMLFDLLLLNRIYRPNELANAAPLDEFNKKRSELKFV